MRPSEEVEIVCTFPVPGDFDDNTRWTTNTTRTAAQGRQQVIHYNLLTGELLVDNRPPGRLPAEYTGHALYQRLFNLVSDPQS